MKNEDLLVFILTPKSFIRAYRFYGLRHSQILSGIKIDFSLDESSTFLPRLREPMQLSLPYERSLMLYWQEFMKLFYQHLKDSQVLDDFYFKLLDKAYKRFAKQDPKRVIIDCYSELLSFEGRLDDSFSCFLCDLLIKDSQLVLVRAFLAAHTACIPGFCFAKEKLQSFYKSHNSSIFEDDEITQLYTLVKEGF